MTESEWLVWDKDPSELLSVVRQKISDRKLRLFACACVRQIDHLSIDERSVRAVRIAELLADRLVSDEDAHTAREAANAAVVAAASMYGPASPQTHLAMAAKYTLARSGLIAFAAANRVANAGPTPKRNLQALQCHVFRDISGNPFRSSSFDRSNRMWKDRAVVEVARAIYDEDGFDRLDILADALERAECNDLDILAHCRQSDKHVKGCQVVDLILGNE